MSNVHHDSDSVHDQCRENERLERQLANLKKKIEKLEEIEGRLAEPYVRRMKRMAFLN